MLLSLACQPNVPPEPAAAPEAFAPDPMEVQIHTLDNGLTVYLSENHEEARFAARVVVRAGGAQDPDDATGMAHYLEHMLANKGTANLGTLDYGAEAPHLARIRELYDRLAAASEDEVAEIYAQIDAEGLAAQEYALSNELKQLYGLLGAQGLNAFTNHDTTQYVVDLPSNALQPWAVIEGDRFGGPVFRSFQTEVETVYEEKNRSLDNAGRVVSEARARALFGDHPYGRTVLGSVEHLKRPSISKMQAYLDTWYVPNNMAVVLAGDFDADQALALVQEHLGGLEPRPLPELEAPAIQPLDGITRVEVVHSADELVSIAWHTVSINHPDSDALMLMDMMLANGKTGLMEQLEYDQILRSASSFGSRSRLAGYQEVHGTPREGQTVEEVEALLLERIEMLKAGAFTDADLEAVLTRWRVGELYGLEQNRSRVSQMASAFVYESDWDEWRTRIDRLAEVTRDDVLRVANQYLGGDYVVVTRRRGDPVIPKIEAPPITERTLNTSDHSAFFEEVRGLERPELEPQVVTAGEHYTRGETPAGPIYSAPNPFSDLEALTLRWDTGKEHDPTICSGIALWKKSGVGALTLPEVEAQIYASGGSFSASCSSQQIQLSFSGPPEAMPGLIDLIVERLQAPVLDESVREAWLADKLEARQKDKETKEDRSNALNSYAQRGDESTWLKELDDDALKALTTEALLAAPRVLFGLERTVLYVGNGDGAALADRFPADAPQPPEEIPARTYVAPEADRILFIHHPSVQASISIYVGDEAYDPARSPLYGAYNGYMGGSAGLVFQEIREARGMAYSASGGYASGGRLGDQNLVWARAAVQADKAAEAAGLMVEMVRGRPLDPDRYARAVSTAAETNRSRRTGFRGIPEKAWVWDRIGLPGDARLLWAEAYDSQTAEAFDAFRTSWSERPLTITVVGDRERLDLEALAEIAPLQELTIDELVSY